MQTTADHESWTRHMFSVYLKMIFVTWLLLSNSQATSLIWSGHTVSLACCDHPHRSFCQFRRTTWTLLLSPKLWNSLPLNCRTAPSVDTLISVLRHFPLIRHNRTVARTSVLWRDINWLIDWLIDLQLVQSHASSWRLQQLQREWNEMADWCCVLHIVLLMFVCSWHRYCFSVTLQFASTSTWAPRSRLFWWNFLTVRESIFVRAVAVLVCQVH